MTKIQIHGNPRGDNESWCWKEFLKYQDSDQKPFEYPAGTVIYDEVTELTEDQWKLIYERIKFNEQV